MQLYETWKVAKLMSFTTILVSKNVSNNFYWTAGVGNTKFFTNKYLAF